MEQFAQYIDIKLVALIVLSAYWMKSNFELILPTLPMKFKVLILSTIVSSLYAIFSFEILGEKINFYKLLISYFAATSFYELAFKPLEELVKKWFVK